MDLPEPTSITAGRLHLRPWEPSDAGAVLAACSDPLVQRWTQVPVPYTPNHARAYVEEAEQRWRTGEELGLAVCDSSTGQVLGNVGLRPGCDDATWDVGCWALPATRGGGVVPQAVAALAGWGFDVLGAQRVEWMCDPANWSSRRAAQKAGFTAEGVLRGGMQCRGRSTDGWVASRRPDDPDGDTAVLPPLGEPTDGTVALRHWRRSDVADVVRALADGSVARWLPVALPYRVADAEHWLGQLVPAGREGGELHVAVVDAEHGALLRAVALHPDRRFATAEVGYWTAPWARGRGAAGRAALLVARWGVERLGLERVALLTDVDNTASHRAAERAGFACEGVLRAARAEPRGPGRRDLRCYALTAEQLR